MREVTIRILDRDLRPVRSESEGFAVSWSRIHHAPDTGTISVPASFEIAALMMDPEHSAMVYVDGELFGCGRCTDSKASIGRDGLLTATYTGLFKELDYLLVYPVPDQGIGGQAATWGMTGPAEDVIKALVVEQSNRGPGVDRHSWSADTPQGRGETVTVSARFVPVSQVLKDIWPDGVTLEAVFAGSAVGGLAPRLVSKDVRQVRPALLFDSPVISGDPQLVVTPPEVTHVTAGGEGEGVDRLLINDVGAAGTSWRREAFIDESSETNAALLREAASRALRPATASVTGLRIVEDGKTKWGWGRTHDIGDVFTIITNWGSTVTAPVKAVHLDVGTDGAGIVTEIGQSSADVMVSVARAARNAAEKIRRLEAR